MTIPTPLTPGSATPATPASPAAHPSALITGATSGIGLSIARALAPTHRLFLQGRNPERLRALAGEFPGASVIAGDVLRSADWYPTEQLPALDVLVASAGLAHTGRIADLPPAQWRAQWEVNVLSVVELLQLALPALRAAGGHVVAINSGSGLRARPGWAGYAATKFALRAVTDALREEEPGLRVTSIHPGRVDTPMQREIHRQENPHENGTAAAPGYDGARYLTAESVAAAVLSAVTATPDAHPTEIVLRPRG